MIKLGAASNGSAEKGTISVDEYRQRRERVLKALKGSAAVVFAGEGGGHGPFKADLDFVYLTGIGNEPGAALLFDPTAADPRRRIVLFLRPLAPETEQWDGLRDPITAELKGRIGFESVMRTGALAPVLARAARRSKRLACLHPFAPYTAGVSRDLETYRKVAERVPGTGIEDQTLLLPAMRAVKSRAELALMRRAAEATAAGYAAGLGFIRPGVSEREVQRVMERAYLEAGAEGTAYESIVGGGLNATVLHYRDNDAPLVDGDLLLIDSGAQFAGYACDVTRTVPISGRFTDEQREVYNVVLRAQLAAIKAARKGAPMWRVDRASREVIEAAGYGDTYVHGVGHQLGLSVHDPDPERELEPGMVITIEPGVYLADKRLGIRIEDDILITESGNKNLTAAVPKTADEIEAAMARGRRPAAARR